MSLESSSEVPESMEFRKNMRGTLTMLRQIINQAIHLVCEVFCQSQMYLAERARPSGIPIKGWMVAVVAARRRGRVRGRLGTKMENKVRMSKRLARP